MNGLQDSLEKLRDALNLISEDEKEEVKQIYEALNSIDTQSDDPDQPEFINGLIELSRVIIKLRRAGSSPRVKKLPVPQYGILLPFKANSSCDDDSGSGLPRGIINIVIDDITKTKDNEKPLTDKKATDKDDR